MKFNSEYAALNCVWRPGPQFRLLALLMALVASGLCVAFVPCSWSQEADQSSFGPLEFHIPRLPLVEALHAYSKASGVEVLYESSIATAVMSTPVEGRFTRQRAIEVLLADTDINVRYTRNDAITLSLLSVETDLPPVSGLYADADLMLDTLRVRSDPVDDVEMRAFSQSTQFDIEAALRRDARTNSGNYRASVQLWVDPTRVVRKAKLTQSTGDAGRDLSIADTLRGLVLRRPPPDNASQPVRIVIVVRSL